MRPEVAENDSRTILMRVWNTINRSWVSCQVTGGSAGIGRAAALAFGQCGARVAIMGRRKERLDAVLADLPEVVLMHAWSCRSVCGTHQQSLKAAERCYGMNYTTAPGSSMTLNLMSNGWTHFRGWSDLFACVRRCAGSGGGGRSDEIGRLQARNGRDSGCLWRPGCAGQQRRVGYRLLPAASCQGVRP